MRPRHYRADAETRLRRPEPPRKSAYMLVDVGGGLTLPDWVVRLYAPEHPAAGRTIDEARTDDLPF